MTTYTRNTLSGSLAPVNNELEKIEVSLREKLDRNPSVAQNNEMLDDLDMNSNRIINYPDAVNDSDLITKGQVASLAPVQSVNGATGNVVVATNIQIDTNAIFDNIAEMKTADLEVGDYVKCKRYYALGELVDGLEFEVVANGTGVDDGGSFHDLSNGNQVQLITNGQVDISVFGAVGEGVADDSGFLINALASPAINKITSDSQRAYLIEQQVNVPSNKHIDFGGSDVIDNVQGFLTIQGVRAAPLFFINDVNNVVIENFEYTSLITRNTVSADIPTGIIWVGRQDGGVAETANVVVRNVVASSFAEHSIFISVLGEAHDCDFHDIQINGDCAFGINIEYGLAASADTKAGQFGEHPYNIKVRNFNGFQNTTCRGFLRVAGAYNILFENCFGYNVTRFMYCWTGDSGISRVDQTVKYLNCCHYTTASFSPATAENIATVIATEFDGSTGIALPSWTNRDLHVIFENCFFENNGVVNGAGLRYIGSTGRVTVNNCTFKNNGWGVRTGTSSGIVTSSSLYTLTIKDSIFKNNYQDLRMSSQEGVTVERCVFKEQIGTAIPVILESTSRAINFIDCDFKDMLLNNYYIDVVSGSADNVFTRCNFDNVGASPSMRLASSAIGYDNKSASTLTLVSSGFFQLYVDEVQTFTPVLTGSTSGTLSGTGRFHKVGNKVSVEMSFVENNSFVGTATITGLPFAPDGQSYFTILNRGRMLFVGANAYGFLGLSSSSTTVQLFEQETGAIGTALTDANFTSNSNNTMYITGTYFI